MKLRSLIFILIFSFLIATPLLFFDFKKTISYRENRTLQALDFGSVNGAGEAIDMVDGWFCDHLGLRDDIFWYLMVAKYKLSGKVNYLNMMEGKNGQWYSFDEYQEKDYVGLDDILTDERLSSDVAGLEAVDEWMAAHDTKFYVMIAPDKHEVMQDDIPPIYVRNDDTFRSDKIANALRDNTDIPVTLSSDSLKYYDGRYDDALREMLKEYPDADVDFDNLFFWKSYDIQHWNYLGAFIAYEDLMKELCKTKDVPVLSFEAARFSPTYFDHTQIRGIDWVEYTFQWAFDTSKIVRDENEPMGYGHFHNRALEDEGTSIVLIGDSYAQSYLVYLLAQSYADVYYAANRDAAATLTNAYSPDVVVFEWASRMYPYLEGGVGTGWNLDASDTQ